MAATILVTGGSGFIGSNFIHYLLNNYQDRVINLDKLTYAGNPDNLQDISNNDNYSFVEGDIADRQLVEEIMQQEVDYLVNFAAESHVDRSIAEPDVFVRTNVLGTQNLLQLAQQYKIKKFVQISTDEVYGSLDSSGRFTENSPLQPSSPYSASKAAADLLTLAWGKTYGLPLNITRCTNNYGPYQFPEKLIPFFTLRAMQSEQLPLYGDGLNVRDWIHVLDHCRAVDLVLRDGKPGQIYNIGAGNEKSNLEITKLILEELGQPESLISYVADRPGHDRRYAVDSERISRELGWQPIYTFKEGIKETISWYRDHQDWWQRIKNGAYRKGN